MNHLYFSILSAALLVGTATQAQAHYGAHKALTFNGTVERYLVNPDGEADGILLTDGTQVNFPPNMSDQLTAVVNPHDSVEVKGMRWSTKLFKAESITNTKTKDLVVMNAVAGPGESRQSFSVEGKVQNQVFGKNGDVNGVILSDGTNIHFGPAILEGSDIDLDVGQKLKVSGLGTKNAIGLSIEASKVANE